MLGIFTNNGHNNDTTEEIFLLRKSAVEVMTASPILPIPPVAGGG